MGDSSCITYILLQCIITIEEQKYTYMRIVGAVIIKAVVGTLAIHTQTHTYTSVIGHKYLITDDQTLQCP